MGRDCLRSPHWTASICSNSSSSSNSGTFWSVPSNTRLINRKGLGLLEGRTAGRGESPAGDGDGAVLCTLIALALRLAGAHVFCSRIQGH